MTAVFDHGSHDTRIHIGPNAVSGIAGHRKRTAVSSSATDHRRLPTASSLACARPDPGDVSAHLQKPGWSDRRLWSRHDVRETVRGRKTFRAPEVVLDWDTYPLPGNPGPVMVVFTAQPGSPDADRLALLATLKATRTG